MERETKRTGNECPAVLRRFAPVLQLLLTCCTLAAQGQQAQPDTLSTVLVTALRQQQEAFDVPGAISAVAAAELERTASRSMAESLMGMTGLFMQKTAHNGGSPIVRGLMGNQVLLLMDGIRINNSIFRYGPNQYFNTIDVKSVRKVELLRGGGSVRYGSDALGGSLHVLTREARFSDSDSTRTTGHLNGRWLSQGMERSCGASLEVSSPGLAFWAGINARDFGDLKAGGELGYLRPSSYQEQAADAKLKVKTGKNGMTALAWNGVFQSGAGRYDQVAQRGFDLSNYHPQDRQLAYTRWDYSPGRHSLIDEISLAGGWQHSLEGRESRRTGSNATTFEKDQVNTLFLVGSLAGQVGKKWNAACGAEIYHDQVRSSKKTYDTAIGMSKTARGLYPDRSKSVSAGIFSSHALVLGKTALNAGVRYNHHVVAINDELFGETRICPAALVHDLALHHQLRPRHAVKASFNTGFRAPNINDLSSFGKFDSGVEVPSYRLRPERSRQLELGYLWSYPRFKGGVFAYQLRLRDLVARVASTYGGQPVFEGDPVFQKANLDKATISGVEAEGQLEFSDAISANWNFSYTYGVEAGTRHPLRRIPPLNGLINLSCQYNPLSMASVELLFAGKQARLSPGDLADHRIPPGGTPAWVLLNLRVGCERQNSHLHLGIQNILNAAYRIHGSGIDGAGRHLWVSTKWFFGAEH